MTRFLYYQIITRSSGERHILAFFDIIGCKRNHQFGIALTRSLAGAYINASQSFINLDDLHASQMRPVVEELFAE